MPRGDKTGPAGQGPRTGRGMGNCAGYKRSKNKGRPSNIKNIKNNLYKKYAKRK